MRRLPRLPHLATLGLAVSLVAGCRAEPPAQEPSAPPPVETTASGPDSAASGTEQTVEAETPAASPTVAPPPRTMGTTPPAEMSRGDRASAVTSSPSIAASPAEGAPRGTSAPPAGAPVAAPSAAPAAAPRMLRLPAGTALALALTTTVASDTSAVEDPVTARVTRDVEVDGETVIPAGATLGGRVTHAQESGRVKGLAALTVRFYTLSIGTRTYDVAVEPLRRQAQPTKGKDAQKVGIGAGAGAVVGGLLGGRRGAAIGAAAGGAGGAGVVVATRGDEVRLDAGTPVTLALTEPLVVPGR